MSRKEYLEALRKALAGLPETERASAVRYYEEYFDDAGPENEAKAAAELGDPQKVAAQILNDYQELATTIPATKTGQKKSRQGVSPVILLLLLLLALPIGVPLVIAAFCIIFALLAALCALAAVVVIIPLCLAAGGGALTVFSFFVWHHPASALATLGSGLALLATGILLLLLLIKLCILFVPPLFRGFVAILRWPFDRIRGVK